MRATDEQYEMFRNEISDIRDTFFKLEHKIGDVPMTIRFMRSINNLCSDMMQMYYEEIKDVEEKAVDAKLAEIFTDRKRSGYNKKA